MERRGDLVEGRRGRPPPTPLPAGGRGCRGSREDSERGPGPREKVEGVLGGSEREMFIGSGDDDIGYERFDEEMGYERLEEVLV